MNSGAFGCMRFEPSFNGDGTVTDNVCDISAIRSSAVKKQSDEDRERLEYQICITAFSVN